jgi:long-subunit acyl-CoA synthetase (AMP-forming)
MLTLDGDVAPAWARAHRIEASSRAELAQQPAVLAAVPEGRLPSQPAAGLGAKVKKWRLLPVEWTAESEERTPTLKLKRRVSARQVRRRDRRRVLGLSPGRVPAPFPAAAAGYASGGRRATGGCEGP